MTTEEFIEIHWTSGTLDEARHICHSLVEQRYVACAQIIPSIESLFLWNKKVDTTQESKVVLKTRLTYYDKIKEIIEQSCSYEVPEITWHQISGGNQSYMNWLRESTERNEVKPI